MGHHGGGSCVGCPTKRPPRKVNPITLLSGHRCCLATHARTPPQRAPAPAAEQRDRLGVADARRVGARDVPGEDAGGPAGRQGEDLHQRLCRGRGPGLGEGAGGGGWGLQPGGIPGLHRCAHGVHADPTLVLQQVVGSGDPPLRPALVW